MKPRIMYATMCDKRSYQAVSHQDERDRESEETEITTTRVHAVPLWKSGRWQGGPSCRKETVWGAGQRPEPGVTNNYI